MGGETGFRLTIGDEPLVRKVFLESEMAHLRCVHAPVCLDNANVVIDRMTIQYQRRLLLKTSVISVPPW